MRINWKFVALSAFLMTGSMNANAGTVDGRTITGFGCNNISGTCFVNMSGAKFGPAGCQSVQIQWDGASVNGKNLTATLLSAKIAESAVRIGFADVCAASATTPTANFVTLM